MPFVKGQSGNPGGRPKRIWTWAMELEKAAEVKDEKSGKTLKEIVAERVIKEAAKGNILAAKEAFNRMDGMPQQSTDLTTDGKPINVIITEDKPKEDDEKESSNE